MTVPLSEACSFVPPLVPQLGVNFSTNVPASVAPSFVLGSTYGLGVVVIDTVYVLVFAGAVTVTMPAAPTWGGASIGLMVANGRTDNAVAWNGAKHQGIADAQMSIDDPFASFQLVPLNATYGWGIA